MDTSKLFEILAYTLPSLITGGVAYYLFNSYFKDQEKKRRWVLQKENQKEALPLRLQAYERMALFLERINPSNLLIRVTPYSSDKNQYENLIIEHINQEYEHNLTQQIYLTDECWTIILTAKNTTIQNIRKTNMSEKVDSANKLREVILSDLLDTQSPSTLALSFLKNEVSSFL
jgi:RNase H-fold protein (predicted Holliday junction resolvase)